MERPNGAVDDKHIGIGGFIEGTNFGHMVLVWCASNEVHWFISYGVNRGDNFRYVGSFRINVGDSLDNLEVGASRGRLGISLSSCIGRKTYIGWGGGVGGILFVLSFKQTSEEEVVLRGTPTVGAVAVSYLLVRFFLP